MSIKILLSSARFASAVVLLAASVFLAVSASTRAASIFDITYPIAELGGCEDRLACKAYCADESNEDTCEEFAASYGISSAPRIDKSEKLKSVQKDGGPGQCAVGADDPQASCKAYCDSTEHIDECVSYGKSHGLLTGEQLAEAEKVASALKRGAKLPDGCTSQNSCKKVCENPSSLAQAKSCFAFGREAGLLPEDFDESRAEKVFKAIEDGTAPFKSPKDFRQCERPKDEEVLKKCVSFAVQSGMMTQEEADVVQKTGGKGPGGCVGENECRAYCEEHQQECFQFSKEHNLVKPEQEAQMKRGAEQFKQNLERAPESVRACLASSIGQEVLDSVASGAAMLDRGAGEKMRSCFEAGMREGRPEGMPGEDGGQFSGPPRGEDAGRYGPPEDYQEQRMEPPREMMGTSSSGRVFEGRPTGPYNEGPRPYYPPQGTDGYGEYKPPEGVDRSQYQMMPPGAEGQYYPQQGDAGYGEYRPPEGATQPPPEMTPPQDATVPQSPVPYAPPSETVAPPPPSEPQPAPVSILDMLTRPASFMASILPAFIR